MSPHRNEASGLLFNVKGTLYGLELKEEEEGPFH